MPNNEETIKEILNDPEKILNLFRTFHNLLHIYEMKKMQNINEEKPMTSEKIGMSDSIEIMLNNVDAKEVRI